MTVLTPVFVSYLVPCFNHEKFVIQALNSILFDSIQTHESFEILIVDDGSTDQSAKKIEQWVLEHSNIKVSFFKNENQGVSKSLNFLISKSSGLFLRVIASDDLLIAGSTKSMISALSQSQDGVAVCADVETIGDQGELISSSHLKFQSKSINLYRSDLKQAIISEWGLSGPAILLKAQFVSQVGLYDPDLIIEDWNMYMRLAAAGKLLFLDGPVAQYRIHTENTSRTKDRIRKIKNLSHQIRAGEKCLSLFSGTYIWLLRSEISLLKAKVSFLNSKFIETSFLVIQHGYFFLRSKF